MAPLGQPPRKLCFVTIGATASFDPLLSACLEPRFLSALTAAGYTDLLIQYGNEGRSIFECFKASQHAQDEKHRRLNIDGFGFNNKGLGQEMRAAKGAEGGVEGAVISHAGSGSILDALRINVPLIVVPNPDLLDNHQVELAEELASQGYVVHGKLNDLSAAILESEERRQRQKHWPPVNSGDHRGLAGVMDDEMGFVD